MSEVQYTIEEQIERINKVNSKYENSEILIAGTQHREHIQLIEKLHGGEKALLVRVFGNPWDDNAIDVRNTDDEMYGHFTEEDCALLAPILEDNKLILSGEVARVVQLSELPKGSDRPKVYIKLSYKKA